MPVLGFRRVADAPSSIVNDFAIRLAQPADGLVLARMLELYQHDLSDIWDQDLDAEGNYGYALDAYWQAAGHHPFMAMANGHHAGFALVNRAVRSGSEGWWMDQFFILKKYRRQGLGGQLARSVWTALPGRWEVGQMPLNHAAQAFWRRLVADYTAGRFEERELCTGSWQGVIQIFDSPRTGS